MQPKLWTASRSRFGRLRSRVRSVLTLDGTVPSVDGTGGASADETADAGDGSRSSDVGNLFHCPTCAVVYVAAEKRVCSQCDGDVEQVRSTLSCR